MNGFDYLEEALASVTNAFKSLSETCQRIIKVICNGFSFSNFSNGFPLGMLSKSEHRSKNWTSIKKDRYIRKENRHFSTSIYQQQNRKNFHRKVLRR